MLNKAGCSLTCWAPSSAEPHQVQQKKLSQHCRSHGPGYPLPLLTPLRSTDWFRVSQQACVVWALRLRQFNWYSVITQRWPILPRALALAISLSLSLSLVLFCLFPLSRFRFLYLSLSVSLSGGFFPIMLLSVMLENMTGTSCPAFWEMMINEVHFKKTKL